jgi:hypothetical protein
MSATTCLELRRQSIPADQDSDLRYTSPLPSHYEHSLSDTTLTIAHPLERSESR